MDKKENYTNELGGTGRVSNIDGSGQTDASRDISSIDRQEGEMDHGETGGNPNVEIKTTGTHPGDNRQD